jgi:hypothetical protein
MAIMTSSAGTSSREQVGGDGGAQDAVDRGAQDVAAVRAEASAGREDGGQRLGHALLREHVVDERVHPRRRATSGAEVASSSSARRPRRSVSLR